MSILIQERSEFLPSYFALMAFITHYCNKDFDEMKIVWFIWDWIIQLINKVLQLMKSKKTCFHFYKKYTDYKTIKELLKELLVILKNKKTMNEYKSYMNNKYRKEQKIKKSIINISLIIIMLMSNRCFGFRTNH